MDRMAAEQMDFSTIPDLPSVSFPHETFALPDASGVYFVVDHYDSCVYVGRAKSLKKRWNAFHDKKDPLEVCRIVLGCEFRICYFLCDNPKEVERVFLKKGKPVFNGCSDCLMSIQKSILPWTLPEQLNALQVFGLQPFLDRAVHRRPIGILLAILGDWAVANLNLFVPKQCP